MRLACARSQQAALRLEQPGPTQPSGGMQGQPWQRLCMRRGCRVSLRQLGGAMQGPHQRLCMRTGWRVGRGSLLPGLGRAPCMCSKKPLLV